MRYKRGLRRKTHNGSGEPTHAFSGTACGSYKRKFQESDPPTRRRRIGSWKGNLGLRRKDVAVRQPTDVFGRVRCGQDPTPFREGRLHGSFHVYCLPLATVPKCPSFKGAALRRGDSWKRNENWDVSLLECGEFSPLFWPAIHCRRMSRCGMGSVYRIISSTLRHLPTAAASRGEKKR